MRIVFAGTPAFAVPSLRAAHAHHEVVAVYTQPDRPAGRGRGLTPSPVKLEAIQRGIPVLQPLSLKKKSTQDALREMQPDVMIVVAYGLILPQAVLDIPQYGCWNVHASLLPRWRGAAPIQRAILAGDVETGVTIMQMDAGLDTGDMLLTQKVAITPRTTAGMLHDQLAETGARLIVEAVARYSELEHVKQPEIGVTYAAKLAKDEGRIDWTRPAVEIERQVRGLNPWPGVWCTLNEERLKVLETEVTAEVTDGSEAPGTALDDALAVACGEGALRLTRVQRAGKAPMAAADLLRGFAVPKGSRFG